MRLQLTSFAQTFGLTFELEIQLERIALIRCIHVNFFDDSFITATFVQSLHLLSFFVLKMEVHGALNNLVRKALSNLQ